MKLSALAFAAALAVSSPLVASAAMSTPPPTSVPNRVGEVPLSVTAVGLVAYGHRASKIIGSTVYNDEGQNIGRVVDLVLAQKDSVSIIVVSVGGFLGLGAKDVAVDASRFIFDKDRVVLPHATKQALKDVPAFHFAH